MKWVLVRFNSANWNRFGKYSHKKNLRHFNSIFVLHLFLKMNVMPNFIAQGILLSAK